MAGSAGTLLKSLRAGAATRLSELIWRDFYFMVLHHHPRLADCASFKPEFDTRRPCRSAAPTLARFGK
jgi:deoxyribodipyrimidine photolyase